jgi:hypothetical protein
MALQSNRRILRRQINSTIYKSTIPTLLLMVEVHNTSAIPLSMAPETGQRSFHLEIGAHYIRRWVNFGTKVVQIIFFIYFRPIGR